MLFFKSLAAVSAATSIVYASAVTPKRAATVNATTSSIGQIYAFGTNISGLPLIFGDGVAFLGDVWPENVVEATNVSFAEVDNELVVSPTNTSLASNWTDTRLFINQTSGAFVSAGFTTPSNTNETITGFGMFGTLLVWISSNGTLESKWYAEPTDQEGLYFLKWNVDNVIKDDAVTVTLKKAISS